MIVDDQNLDQGSKICSIFKVLEMQRKRCHCVRLVLLIPAVYLLSQTESVWRSYRLLFAEPNRENFDADWAGHTTDVAGRTVTWQDRTAYVAIRTRYVAAPGHDTCHAFMGFLACILTNWKVTRVTTGWVTRGTRVTSAVHPWQVTWRLYR